MPNFKETVGYKMRSSIKKLTSALKLSGSWKERPQDIRKPMKEGAGTIAKKTAPTKLSGAWKERPQDIRKPMKEGAGTIAKKVKDPTKGAARVRRRAAGKKQYKTEGLSRRPSKRA